MGKSSLINALNNHKFTSNVAQTEDTKITPSNITFPSGDNKIVIMVEIPPDNLSLLQTDPSPAYYDLICVCFDNQNHLIKFFREYSKHLPKCVPKLGVHCKIDSDEFEVYDQSKEIEEELSEKFGLTEIVECSSKNEELRDVLSGMMKMIKNP